MERSRTEHFSSKAATVTLVEKTDGIVEERQVREEGVWRAQEIPLKPAVIERVDDWFVLLDVPPRETSYAPAGTAETPCAVCPKKLWLSRAFYRACSLMKEGRSLLAIKDFLRALLISYVEGKNPGGWRGFCLRGRSCRRGKSSS